MSGLFEHIEMFDESDKVATRQAIAVANKRFNDKFAGFLRQASTKKEFESRLALVDTDINNMVADVANEYGGDAEKIAAAIKDAAAMTHTATCDCDGKCEGTCKCGGCDNCKCDSKKTANEYDPYSEGPAWDKAVELFIYKYGTRGDTEENARYHINEQKDRILQQVRNPQNVQEVLNAIAKIFGIEPQHDPYDGDDGHDNPFGDKFSKNEERPERLKAQDEIQLADEHSQVSPWLKKQIQDEDQEDGGNLRNKEANESWSNPNFEHGNSDSQYENEYCKWCNGSGCEACERKGPDSPDIKPIPTLPYPKDISIEANINSQPIANPVPLERSHGTNPLEREPNDDRDASLAKQPSAVGNKTSGAHKVEEKGDKFYVTEKGEGEVAGPFDSSEDAHARANELNDLENLEKEAGLWSDFVRDQRKPQAAPAEGATPTDEDDEIDDLDILTPPESPDNPDDYILGPVGMAAAHGLENAGNWAGRKLFGPNWPNRGASVTPAMAKALQLKEAAKPETGDKTEERESLPKGDEDALGGPSPKIDKKKWVPNATNPDGNLEPIDTEGENSPHPTRHMDIKQKPDYQQDTLENLDKYDNNVWSREQLPSADDNAGFNTERNISQDGQSGTFSDKGQAKPVTREALATMDKTASFRAFLNDIGMPHEQFVKLDDEQKSKLWDIYNNYDMPWYMADEGLDQPLKEEPTEEEIAAEPAGIEEPNIEEEIAIDEPVDEPIEEPIIDEGPEDIEDIIEREDDDDDRVEVIDEDEDLDLDEEDPFADAENISDEELQDLIEEFEDNPDEY